MATILLFEVDGQPRKLFLSALELAGRNTCPIGILANTRLTRQAGRFEISNDRYRTFRAPRCRPTVTGLCQTTIFSVGE
jgi:hypothetical protein